jgi:hypothetical protein
MWRICATKALRRCVIDYATASRASSARNKLSEHHLPVEFGQEMRDSRPCGLPVVTVEISCFPHLSTRMLAIDITRFELG